MNQERLEAACWAAELRRKGTLLSDQAVAEVCEALLELSGEGTITLELHERVLSDQRKCRVFEVAVAREETARQAKLVDEAMKRLREALAENERLGRLAYIGDHHFDDLTYKARLEEMVPQYRALEDEVARLEALRVQGVAMGQAANRRIEELERQLADSLASRKAEYEHANRWAARAHTAEALVDQLKLNKLRETP